MGIIAWIVLGAVAGYLATFITGAREGVVMTVILGIVGALVGGFLAGAILGLKEPMGLNLESIVVAAVGAIVVVVGAGLVFGSQRRHRSI